LQQVHQYIEREEWFTTTPSDDCIQIGGLCGGLMDDDSGRFSFSVHLEDNSPYVWDIALTPAEIKEIVDGKLTAIPLWCCSNESCGYKTYLEDITCHWCDYGRDRTPRKKADPAELQLLTEEFRQLGVSDPESWAHMQLIQDVPQLAIFRLLKALWTKSVVDEGDASWIDPAIEQSREYPTEPCAQMGSALAEMLEKGVSRQTIVDFVRVIQYEALWQACSILDGNRSFDRPVHRWAVYQVDESGRPIAVLNRLHDFLDMLDPTGREMRPRPVPDSDLQTPESVD